MALQELNLKELNEVSGAVWDDVDWLAAAAAAGAAAVTGGFGWAAAGVTAAVEAVARLPSGGYVSSPVCS